MLPADRRTVVDDRLPEGAGRGAVRRGFVSLRRSVARGAGRCVAPSDDQRVRRRGEVVAGDLRAGRDQPVVWE